MTNEDKYSRSLSYHAWQRLKRNKLAMSGLIVIVVAAIVAVLGSLVRPDPSPHANDQKLALGKKKPGFSIQMLLVRKNKEAESQFFWKRMFFGGKESEYKSIPIYGYEFSGTNIIVEEYTGLNENYPGKKIVFNLADVVYPIDFDNKYREDGFGNISFFDVQGQQVTLPILELRKMVQEDCLVNRTFWLGTDQFGRDMLSRLMAGTLVSLSVGLISVFISLLIGIMIGAVGGFFGGKTDDVVMWIINVVWSVPTLLLVIAVVFALGKGFWQIFIAVGLTMWVETARVVRGQVITLREKEFVEAGKALGFTNFRLIARHILPNVMSPVIVIAASDFASAILIESGLSFLGIGLQPPMASWGRMIKEHYGFIMADGAFLAILPGLAIMIMVLAFMLLGNGLRDALDAKSMDAAKAPISS